MYFNKLRKIRIENNLKIQDMADILNISKAFYCQIEGKKRKLSYKMAYEISKIFKLKPDDIFYEDFK